MRPQCGRVVGFGAGKENPHGVRAVTKGQRCAVALWFTLDPAHEEKVWVGLLQELIFMCQNKKSLNSKQTLIQIDSQSNDVI